MWPLLLLLLVLEDVAPLVDLAVFQPLVLNPLVVQPLGLMSAQFCHATDHRLLTCHIRVCKTYRQRGPGHYRSDCPNNSIRRDTRPQSTAATAGVSSTASASPTLIDISDLPALVQQIMSASGNPSTALSVSTGGRVGGVHGSNNLTPCCHYILSLSNHGDNGIRDDVLNQPVEERFRRQAGCHHRATTLQQVRWSLHQNSSRHHQNTCTVRAKATITPELCYLVSSVE
ncbi:nucleoside diphosphate kinase [Actinidia rufa]|uniref:Nucleoside diphosphate kinase n=1 Tax=Actinidia rufa TaxID=165716 RepID=A0A7J0E3T5_9ERIC|nr:nucleoside diphosphate kinase [Actinidia rufa]